MNRERCSKGLHMMTPDNVTSSGRGRRCKACAVSRFKATVTPSPRTTPLSHQAQIELRQKQLAAAFAPYAPKDREWIAQAGCIGEDLNAFFPNRMSYNSKYVTEIAERNCEWCPVQKECLLEAITTPLQQGIRAGMLFPGALLYFNHEPLLETLMKEAADVGTTAHTWLREAIEETS